MDASDAWAMRAAHAADPDWSLDELLKLIDRAAFVFPLTVLAGGVFIKGIAVKVEEWASHLDSAMDTLLSQAAHARAAEQQGLSLEDLGATASTAGDIERQRSEWPHRGWTSLVGDRREREATEQARMDTQPSEEAIPLEALPDDLAQAAIRKDLPARTITIKSASVIAPGAPPVEVPFVRVLVAHVAAWWPGRLDAPTAARPHLGA